MSASTGSRAGSWWAMRRSLQGGFTLLEVLIAFAIVAIALAALIKGAGFGFNAVGQSARYEEALSRARSHLAAGIRPPQSQKSSSS